MTVIKGQTGWIIIDPLTSRDTAAAALKLVNEKLGARPVTAVIYSHSHGDHFGGVRGIVNEADVKAGKVKTVQGSELTVSTMGGVKVDSANVVKTDIVADNGVIHVIDTVLLPRK